VHLTRRSQAHDVNPLLGAHLEEDGHELEVRPGSVTAPSGLAITPLRQQGLPAVLPAGWSPLAAVEIAPADATFVTGARLRAPPTLEVADGVPVALIHWNERDVSWRVVEVVSTAGSRLEADIFSAGHFAWGVPDPAPLVPPPASPGDLLSGVAPPGLDPAATGSVAPAPRVLFYGPGVRSEVSGVVTGSATPTSGTIVEAVVRDTYRFTSGTEMRPDPYARDLVLYRTPGATSSLEAAFPVAPLFSFDPLAFDRGAIEIELRAKSADASPPAFVSVDPVTISASGGWRIGIPPGAVASGTAAAISAVVLAGADLGFTIPDGVELAGAINLTLSGSLDRSAVLSLPRPAGIEADARLLVVRLDELDGSTRFRLGAAVRHDGDRLVSDLAPAGTGLPF
jgi:hypothetical protein